MEHVTFLDLLLTILMTLLFVNVIMNKLRIKEPTDTLHRDSLPSVSVLIPTRNEAKNIKACLNALAAQDHPRFEVIVVDDSSTDNTLQIANEIAINNDRIRLARGREIAPHWIGKPYASFQAAQASRGKYLLFLDADVVLNRKALTMMVSAAKKRGAGIVSMIPFQKKDGFIEGILAPFKYFHLFLLFPSYAMDWPWEPLAAYAHGQCMMIEREAYKKIGGHSSGSESIREGVAIARTMKKKGGKIRLLSGASLAKAKVHGKPPELWEGLTRYLYSMANRSMIASLLLALLYFILFVFPTIKLLVLPFTMGFTAPQLIMPAAQFVLGVTMFTTAVGSFGLTLGEAIMLPVSALIWVAMFIRAILVVMSKQGILWKGRTIHLK